MAPLDILERRHRQTLAAILIAGVLARSDMTPSQAMADRVQRILDWLIETIG